MKKYINYSFFNKNRIIFDREGHFNNIKLSPLLVKNINYQTRKEFVEQVKKFIITMNNQCKSFNADLFYSNFSKISFKFYTRKNYQTGIVIFLKKKCKIYDMDSILHELIHISTIKVNGSTEYCGFSINDYYYGDSFAKGLNEGYTQLIKERYFGKDKAIVYPFEVKYAKMIESLIGKEKMEKYFFNIDLKALFKEIEKYTSEEKFKDFLNNLDYINAHFPSGTNDQIIQEKFDQINYFLFECFKQKLEKEPDNKDILDNIKILFDKDIVCRSIKDNQVITIKNLEPRLLTEYLDTNKKR